MPGLHETRLKHKETFLILKRGKVSYTTVVNGANTLIFYENVQQFKTAVSCTVQGLS